VFMLCQAHPSIQWLPILNQCLPLHIIHSRISNYCQNHCMIARWT
jgi:hypothetical protein